MVSSVHSLAYGAAIVVGAFMAFRLFSAPMTETVVTEPVGVQQLRSVRGGACYRTITENCPNCPASCSEHSCSMPNENNPEEWVCDLPKGGEQLISEYNECETAVTGNTNCVDSEPNACCKLLSCTTEWCEMDLEGDWKCPSGGSPEWTEFFTEHTSMHGPCPEG